MDSEALFVSWTMDCEAIDDESPSGGPVTWELGAKAMRGYVESLAARGHRATLFLTPRVAEVQADLVLDLIDAGAEPGMHLHPQNADLQYPGHLGELEPEVQREALRVSRDRIEQALGVRPTGFRPGCFSASDATYSILVELGFTHGSVSLPGRVLPGVAAVWPGAEPFAHWANADSRTAAGDLPFVEMPTAVDLAEWAASGPTEGDVRHLRIERDGIREWGPGLVQRHIARQVELDVSAKTLIVMTHNTREYDEPGDQFRQNLEALADAIGQAADAAGLRVVPATLAQIRAEM